MVKPFLEIAIPFKEDRKEQEKKLYHVPSSFTSCIV